MTDKEKEVILQMCKCDMNVSEVAREMYSHRNTIVYHLEKIKQHTKLDPLRFYDLVKLREMVSDEEKEDKDKNKQNKIGGCKTFH